MASIAKVIEVKAEGSTIEEAIESAATAASRSVRNVQQVWIKDIEAVIDGGSVSRYRINAKATFVVDESSDMS